MVLGRLTQIIAPSPGECFFYRAFITLNHGKKLQADARTPINRTLACPQHSFQLIGEAPYRAHHLLGTVLDLDNHLARLVGQGQALLSLDAAGGHVPYRFVHQLLVLLDDRDNFLRGGAGDRKSAALSASRLV